jgi:hypothetical protein
MVPKRYRLPGKASVGKETAAKLVQLDSLARGYTEVSIKRLGGYITCPKEDPWVVLRAIEIMLDRGWGKVKGSADDSSAPTQVVITIRNLMEEIANRPKMIEHED